MLVQGFSGLQIKPLGTYKGSGHGETTLTPFSDVLSGQRLESADVQTEQPVTNTSSNADSNTVYFKDPTTGQAVQYIDVSKEAETEKVTKTTKSKSSSSAKTTSASSMKKTKYDSYFKKAAEKYGVPESLLKAVAKAESNFNAKDVSGSGAMGVMQLMPATAKGLGVKDPFDPEQNIMGGAKCLSQKIKEFNGNLELALAAYNAGSGAVKRNGGVPSYCKSYVNKVISYKKAYETAASVG